MLYKTICLQLLEQHPVLHEQLKSQRLLLPTLECLSKELKTSHEAWKEQLFQAKPDSDPSQIASEALEIALKDLEDALDFRLPSDERETLSLDAAMEFIRRRTSPA